MPDDGVRIGEVVACQKEFVPSLLRKRSSGNLPRSPFTADVADDLCYQDQVLIRDEASDEPRSL